MNYQALYDYIHDISQNMGLSVKFFHGEKSLLNLATDYKALFCYSLPFTSSGSFVPPQANEEWVVTLIFYQLDQPDSGIDQNDQDKMQGTIKTLAVTEEAANIFLRLANSNSISDDLSKASEKLTISRFSKEPAIRDTAQLLTGIVLTLNIRVPDRFNYCSQNTFTYNG